MRIRIETIYKAGNPLVTPFDDGSVGLHEMDLDGGYRVDFRPEHLPALRELIQKLGETSSCAMDDAAEQAAGEEVEWRKSNDLRIPGPTGRTTGGREPERIRPASG